jgi:chromosome segregation ATPase
VSVTNQLDDILVEVNELSIKNIDLNTSIQKIKIELSSLTELAFSNEQEIQEMQSDFNSIQINQTDFQDIFSELENLTKRNEDLQSELDDLNDRVIEGEDGTYLLYLSNAISLILGILVIFFIYYLALTKKREKKNE